MFWTSKEYKCQSSHELSHKQIKHSSLQTKTNRSHTSVHVYKHTSYTSVHVSARKLQKNSTLVETHTYKQYQFFASNNSLQLTKKNCYQPKSKHVTHYIHSWYPIYLLVNQDFVWGYTFKYKEPKIKELIPTNNRLSRKLLNLEKSPWLIPINNDQSCVEFCHPRRFQLGTEIDLPPWYLKFCPSFDGKFCLSFDGYICGVIFKRYYTLASPFS